MPSFDHNKQTWKEVNESRSETSLREKQVFNSILKVYEESSGSIKCIGSKIN